MAKVDTGIRGLNTGGITKMKNQIDTYKRNVNATQNVGVTASQISANLKGSNAQFAIKQMGDAIKTEVSQLLADLDAFKVKLDEVQKAYQAHDVRAAQNINTRRTKIQNIKS
jgi:hypothetical protein